MRPWTSTLEVISIKNEVALVASLPTWNVSLIWTRFTVQILSGINWKVGFTWSYLYLNHFWLNFQQKQSKLWFCSHKLPEQFVRWMTMSWDIQVCLIWMDFWILPPTNCNILRHRLINKIEKRLLRTKITFSIFILTTF